MLKLPSWRRSFVLIASLVAIGGLYLIEQEAGASYVAKTASKLILFIGLPLFYLRAVKRQRIAAGLHTRQVKLKDLRFGFIFGLLGFAAILILYQILKSGINLDLILSELTGRLQITPATFIFVGLYITFVNSFIEEFFFRGFIFLNLYEQGHRFLGYVFSSALFALYHLAIFRAWFEPLVMAIALVGLFLVGLFFNWVNTRKQNFLNSWIIHLSADAAIILIGFRLFQLI